MHNTYTCTVRACSVVSDSFETHGLQPARLLCPRDSPGKDTGVGCPALLQGIFPIQGSNPRLIITLALQAGPLPLALPGKPNIVYSIHYLSYFILYMEYNL